jgi:hypothetical protein
MKLKKVMFGLGVGILSALFIGFLIEAIYPVPEYEDFCRSFEGPAPQPLKESACTYTYNPEMRATCSEQRGIIRQEYDAQGCVVNESCDYCEKDYRTTLEEYNRNLFYVTAPIGLAMIIAGLYLPATVDAIAGGVLLGGILTMIQITMRVFGTLGRWPRVILLGLELVIVILIGMKKVREAIKKK